MNAMHIAIACLISFIITMLMFIWLVPTERQIVDGDSVCIYGILGTSYTPEPVDAVICGDVEWVDFNDRQ